MAALLTSSRKHLAATSGLHASTEPVRLGAAAFPRLICALWQSNPPYKYVAVAQFISLELHTTTKPRQRPFPNLVVYSTPRQTVKNADDSIVVS